MVSGFCGVRADPKKVRNRIPARMTTAICADGSRRMESRPTRGFRLTRPPR
jgi:hypothetical protein